MQKDYYKILEITFPSNEIEIKKAYRELSKRYHPDKNFGNKIFEEKFREINEAYNILIDPAKKEYYDSKYTEYKKSKETEKEKNERSNEGKQGQNESHTNMNNQKTNSTQQNYNLFDLSKFKIPRLMIFGILGIVAVVVYKWSEIQSYYDKKNKENAKALIIDAALFPKEYKEKSFLAYEIPKTTLETKWRDSLMYYKFTVFSKYDENDTIRVGDTVYSKKMYNVVFTSEKFKSKLDLVYTFTINFLDKEGFKVYSLDIPKSDMTQGVDENGNITEYSINTNVKMLPELYSEFNDWSCTIR